ncbi:MAG: S8 family serine peptidase [Bacteroidota bacterium]
MPAFMFRFGFLKKFVLLIVCCGNLSLPLAQSPGDPSRDGSSYFYYGPNGIESLTLSTEKVIIRFRDGLSLADKQTLLSNEPALLSLSENMMMPAPKVSLVPLRSSVSEEDVLDILNRLENLNDIHYAKPFLQYKDGVLQGLMDEFVVKMRQGVGIDQLQELMDLTQTTVLRQDPYTPSIYYCQTSKHSMGNAMEMANFFHTSSLVEYAEPNFLVQLRKHTNDPFYAYQWSIENTGSSIQHNGTPDADMDVDLAWNTTTGSAGISVAILDEGVDLTHPDLLANMLPGFDATNLGSNGGPAGDDSHGTACAGIVAANANNGIGVAGVAYNCKIVPIRIAYSDSSGSWVTSFSQISAGINWAWNQGQADILSNSWGGGSNSSLINTAITNSLTSGRGGLGSPVLFSAGNGNGTVSYPASNNNTIAVGAMSMCNERKNPSSCDGESWWGSDFGTNLDVAAPGVKIFTTDISGSDGYNNGDYVSSFNGTSSACPNAAGVMALILSYDSSLTAAQARAVLEQSCAKVGSYTYTLAVTGQPNGSWSSQLGYGCVNAQNALQFLITGGIPIVCNNTVGNYPHTESFENGLGLWEQSIGDSLDWLIQSGATPSPGTGPTAAYEGSTYVFIEASQPNYPNKAAGLESPCLDLSGASSASLDFAFHMYGVDMGSLSIQVSSDTGQTWGPVIWAVIGDQGNSWDTASVDLTAFIGQTIKLRFLGMTGTDFASDIALDAIDIDIVSNFVCVSTPISCDTIIHSTTIGAASGIDQYSCIFWDESGPELLYEFTTTVASDIQLSLANLSADLDVFLLDACDPTHCLNFDNDQLIELNAPPGTYYAVVDGYTGASGTFSLEVACEAVLDPTICHTTVNSFPYTQSFENGLGDWVQSLDDSLQWSNQSGGTPSNNTGPSSALDGAYYMYIEASAPNYPSMTAGLQSPCLDLNSATTATFSFAYHMFGTAMGTLAVEVSTDNGQSWGSSIWTVSGNQGNSWDSATIDLTPYVGQIIKVRLLGMTGNNFTSDIAIDRVAIHTTDGPLCQLFPPLHPTNEFASFLGQAEINGVPALDSDSIAAFDSNGNLAGKSPIVVSGGIAHFNLIIYGDDPATASIDEGMNTGETFSLRLKHLPACEVLWYPDMSNPQFFSAWQNTNGQALPGFDDPNDVYNFGGSDVDSIFLRSGWNLVSFDVMPDDSSVAQVFGSLLPSNLEYVTSFDGGSQLYDPNGLAFLNTLTEIERYAAYWVRVNTDDTLILTGSPINPTRKKDLDAGWNLAAYVPQLPDTPNLYFNSLINAGNLSFVSGFDNGALIYDPNALPFLNTLTLLQNGFGYWVRVDSAVGGTAYRVPENEFGQAQTPVYNFVNGRSNLGAKAIGKQVLIHREDGTVIAAMEVLEDGYLMTTAVYGDDPVTSAKEGLLAAEMLSFSFEGQESEQQVPFQGDMQLIELLLEFAGDNFMGAFPNPFSEQVSISYILEKKSLVHVEIVNALGQQITTLVNEIQLDQEYQLMWDAENQPEGIYFVNLHVNGLLKETHRILLVRE